MSKYTDWLAMSNRLKDLKAKEMKVRKELCIDIFKDSPSLNKKKFRDGDYLVEAVIGTSYKVDSQALQAMYDELTEAEEEVLTWTPSLKMAAYNKLPADCLIHECVTSKPAAPTLKVTLKKED